MMRVLWRWQWPWSLPRFPEEKFWTWAWDQFKFGSKIVVEKALIAYYVMIDPKTPSWARGVLISALLYFVSPIDLAPDIIPVIGKVDDVGILIAALAIVALHIGPEHEKKAKDKMEQFGFGGKEKEEEASQK